MRLFGDRIAAKRDLLDRVRVGMPLGDLVPTEADEEIEVPAVTHEKRTIMDADLRAPELAQIARLHSAGSLDEDELATGKPWSSRPAMMVPTADSGSLVPPKPPTLPPSGTLPPDVQLSVPQRAATGGGFRWGVLALLLFAIALGGAAGAWLRLYR
ncbi:MAG TPA: hypothetical protein VGC41_12945, partial [Kofleriaceae bacterium]